jgi:CopG-like RHH_1 or ribbon-helix-helix domain, RHH_5
MAGRHLTLRLDESALEHLDREAKRSGQTRSQLARTLIEEGLRMREHPGIVFRDGAVGRRPAIAGGPQIWWIAAVLRGVGLDAKNLVQRTVALTELPIDQVTIALQYYTAYPEEIDAWIDRNNEEGERGYAEWLREQSLSA